MGLGMKIKAVTWASDVALLVEAAKDLGMDLEIWSTTDLEKEASLKRCVASLRVAEVILLHPTQDGYWDEIIGSFDGRAPVIAFARDPTYWSVSTVTLEQISTVNRYILYGGLENIKNMLCYIGSQVMGMDLHYQPPKENLWQGLYHPRAESAFDTVDEYLQWYRPHRKHTVGILFFRTYWANGDLEIVDALIRELEKENDVIPAFCFGMGDRELGAMSSGEVVQEFFAGRIDALINMQSIFHAGSVDRSRQALKELDVPVFHPLTSYHSDIEQWQADIHGLSSSEVGWNVAVPEFEGVIEPLIVGVAHVQSLDGTKFERHRPVEERVQRIASRVGKWIALRDRPCSQRRVAFILHNNPCASAEATVGTAAHLDTLESLARIMNSMKEKGYSIDQPPRSGKELIEAIMQRKAVSEFRWTSVQEIVSQGGALALVEKDDYLRWFDTLPQEVSTRICEAWGAPPGEEKDGVPAAMVYDQKIVVTGIRYGNVVVAVQPKRGCAGSRCDGQVCRILHDPQVPPPHQYLATYRYLEEDFGADVVLHLGTHGNLEFLPGKSLALSESCFPDLIIGTTPHLYIYNADNPPEGTIAKRRSYAVLVDHMQTVMTESGLYGELKELEDQIAEYNRTKVNELGRAHALEHIILDLLERTNLSREIGLEELVASKAPFDTVLERAHDKISEMYNTQMPEGMHIFSEIPTGEKKVELICSILRFDGEMRKFVARLMGRDLEGSKPTTGELSMLDSLSRHLVRAFVEGEGASAVEAVLGDRLVNRDQEMISTMVQKVTDLSLRIDSSDEMGSLFRGFEGRFIEPGPSGLITRGRPDVLPTGRNFYSLDPSGMPTEAAWRVGRRLAQAVIQKYRQEQGRDPENVAMYWMASDIMWADGEQLAQMMYLIGVEPVWKGGSVRGYRVMTLEELGRPRIDITVRLSGITRDCFYNCVEFLDQAIREVSLLDEPPEQNYLHKHLVENGMDPRIFSSMPGTYGNGVNLAVYASAWKEERDLSDVFIHWNGYAYGKGVFGEGAHQKLISQLKSVDLTFNKTVTDEYDLFGCCCYFGTHGGLTAAAREVSGKEVSAYYGDTRDRDNVGVRSLADEVRRVVRTKLLNPKWIEGMKRHGYKGAGDISKRVGRVYGWEATTQEVDDWIFDDIARTFVLDQEMRSFFQESNPWALEEIGRRLLEANQRGLWKADQEVIDELKAAYLEMEGWMEERMGDAGGDIQGGAVRVLTAEEVRSWKDKMSRALGR